MKTRAEAIAEFEKLDTQHEKLVQELAEVETQLQKATEAKEAKTIAKVNAFFVCELVSVYVRQLTSRRDSLNEKIHVLSHKRSAAFARCRLVDRNLFDQEMPVLLRSLELMEVRFMPCGLFVVV